MDALYETLAYVEQSGLSEAERKAFRDNLIKMAIKSGLITQEEADEEFGS